MGRQTAVAATRDTIGGRKQRGVAPPAAGGLALFGTIWDEIVSNLPRPTWSRTPKWRRFVCSAATPRESSRRGVPTWRPPSPRRRRTRRHGAGCAGSCRRSHAGWPRRRPSPPCARSRSSSRCTRRQSSSRVPVARVRLRRHSTPRPMAAVRRQWRAFCERVEADRRRARAAPCLEPLAAGDSLALETMAGALRGQMPARTVRGMMQHAAALRTQALLEGHSAAGAAALVVRSRYRCVPCGDWRASAHAQAADVELLSGGILACVSSTEKRGRRRPPAALRRVDRHGAARACGARARCGRRGGCAEGRGRARARAQAARGRGRGRRSVGQILEVARVALPGTRSWAGQAREPEPRAPVHAASI